VTFNAACTDTDYLFRIRARAEQPDEGDGAWPNHRYHGVWSDPVTVHFQSTAPTIDNTVPTSPTLAADFNLFLPLLANQKPC
jgi:hypothetical protein